MSAEWSDLLMEAGIKTIDELAQSNTEDLFDRLITVNEVKKIVRKLPTFTQVEEWIKKANRRS
ncbi:MAG: DUF4332 domain-containing protein [Anaerolineales bacterium]